MNITWNLVVSPVSWNNSGAILSKYWNTERYQCFFLIVGFYGCIRSLLFFFDFLVKFWTLWGISEPILLMDETPGIELNWLPIIENPSNGLIMVCMLCHLFFPSSFMMFSTFALHSSHISSTSFVYRMALSDSFLPSSPSISKSSSYKIHESEKRHGYSDYSNRVLIIVLQSFSLFPYFHSPIAKSLHGLSSKKIDGSVKKVKKQNG